MHCEFESSLRFHYFYDLVTNKRIYFTTRIGTVLQGTTTPY